jgi:hypothetical protein
MPLIPPQLDDRTYDDLLAELLARIPAHTPEWTDPRPGDPGRTLVELFSWLTETLLYRVNLIPERQRLSFLRLLGIPLKPARAARGLVVLTPDDKGDPRPFSLAPGATINKPVIFETTQEMTVQPLCAEVYFKRRLTRREHEQFDPLLPRLRQVYGVSNLAEPYVTTQIFIDGAPNATGFDVVKDGVDGMLWMALLAVDENPAPEFVQQIRNQMGSGKQVLHIGVAPAFDVPPLDEQIGPRASFPHAWEMSYVTPGQPAQARYVALSLVQGSDTTAGLIRQGTLQLVLPAESNIGAPDMSDPLSLQAGVGDNPPRIDDPKKAARVIAWLRLRSLRGVNSLPLSWVSANVVEIDARQTMRGRVIGQSDGSANQSFNLPAGSVDPSSLELEVEEPGLGYRTWQLVDDLNFAGRDLGAYALDSEAGMVTFGDGVRGRIPAAGMRLRLRTMRAGGGRNGNLPAGSLNNVSARLVDGGAAPRLKLRQDLPTIGGEGAETIEQAEKRIPTLFRHQERAVTAEDYRRLAAETPGVRVGRVEVLPRFKPQQRMQNVPGVVSVMALPFQSEQRAPNPRADRPFLESVFGQLDARRPLATELYVMGCEYIQIGVSLGITIEEGYPRLSVLQQVSEGLHRFLWPLTPGGIKDQGWELGRSVVDEELRVACARVEGVLSIEGIRLFVREAGRWRVVSPSAGNPARLALEPWQLPELVAVVIDPDGETPASLHVPAGSSAMRFGLLEDDLLAGDDQAASLPIPVAPEVC